MEFEPVDLRDLNAAEEVQIETSAPGGGVHSTIIWVMVDGHEVFVRSVRGNTARWYREAIAEPDVKIVADRHISATAVPVDDPAVIERVSELLRAKYTGIEGLDEMLQPVAVEATFRLEARNTGWE